MQHDLELTGAHPLVPAWRDCSEDKPSLTEHLCYIASLGSRGTLATPQLLGKMDRLVTARLGDNGDGKEIGRQGVWESAPPGDAGGSGRAHNPGLPQGVRPHSSAPAAPPAPRGTAGQGMAVPHEGTAGARGDTRGAGEGVGEGGRG